MDNRDINSDENTTMQHKKLKKTNERHLDNHENKEDNMFNALFFNDEDDFFTIGMVEYNMVTLILGCFINLNTEVTGLE